MKRKRQPPRGVDLSRRLLRSHVRARASNRATTAQGDDLGDQLRKEMLYLQPLPRRWREDRLKNLPQFWGEGPAEYATEGNLEELVRGLATEIHELRSEVAKIGSSLEQRPPKGWLLSEPAENLVALQWTSAEDFETAVTLLTNEYIDIEPGGGRTLLLRRADFENLGGLADTMPGYRQVEIVER